MGLFDKKKPLALQGFRTRRDAFEAMLQHLIEENSLDPMSAAKQADEFANIFAKNMGLPEKIEPEKKGVDLWIENVKKVTTVIKENPEVVEIGKPILLGAFSALAGVFTGAKIVEDNQEPIEPITYEPITFDNDVVETNNNCGGMSGGIPTGNPAEAAASAADI